MFTGHSQDPVICATPMPCPTACIATTEQDTRTSSRRVVISACARAATASTGSMNLDWFASTEAGGRFPLSRALREGAHCCSLLRLPGLCKLLKRRHMVEAAGVELFSELTARNLLILRMGRRAKKAPLPIPLYVYCTETLSRLDRIRTHSQVEFPTVFALGETNYSLANCRYPDG